MGLSQCVGTKLVHTCSTALEYGKMRDLNSLSVVAAILHPANLALEASDVADIEAAKQHQGWKHPRYHHGHQLHIGLEEAAAGQPFP